MNRALLLGSGAGVLVVAWILPLPGDIDRTFSAHMARHMAVVAIAAPLIAAGAAGSRCDLARAWPAAVAPLPASILELMVVWIWHAPALHHAARTSAGTFALEQGSFLLVGLLLWAAALGGDVGAQPGRRAAGVVALLFTSMHMTLLGALFALTPRPLYAHAAHGWSALSPLQDQHLGGAIMLLVGGASYLAGGLWLMRHVLRGRTLAGDAR